MLTRDLILSTLRMAGFKPTSAHDTVVTAERPIPGHPGSYRAVVVTGWDKDWHATVYFKRPRAMCLTEYEYAGVLAERRCIASDEHLALWLGGAISVPVDAAEIRALEAA